MDVRSDAYSLLADAASTSRDAPILQPIGMPLTLEAMVTLGEAGLLDDRPAEAVPSIGPPRLCLADGMEDASASPGAVLDLLLALYGTWRRMRRGLPCRNYRARRSCSAEGSPDALRDAVVALAAARLIVPTPRRCLPDAVVTSLFLARRGVPSEIVFGVRTHPFAAHCWVEVGGAVVGDVLERVAAYAPICVADA